MRSTLFEFKSLMTPPGFVPFCVWIVRLYRMRFQGPPEYVACFVDESFNRTIKSVASTASDLVFHQRAMASCAALQRTKRKAPEV